MGKTYIETIKYLIIADFNVNGLVERPDVIGAIFGQSEGLLGANLDIKELQQNGKIGRIEIEYTQEHNKVRGVLRLPCSVSMVETAIIAASIESIDKVGPCDAVFRVRQIEDTRGVKRKQIKSRAIELLGKLMQEEIPDSRELMDEIMDTFKIKEVIYYGPEKLSAGPTAASSNELIIVEGRADVINMLRYGFTNVIATGGARVPKSIEEITKNKTVTIFLDGDRGADIQQQQLLRTIKVDFVARAPDGKEVEELTQKEINQALRRKIKAAYLSTKTQTKGTRFANLTKQPGIVKATKFSTTAKPKPLAKSSSDTKEFLTTKFVPKAHGQQKSDNFDEMLAQIPGLERVDKSGFRDRDKGFRSKPRDFKTSERRPKEESFRPKAQPTKAEPKEIVKTKKEEQVKKTETKKEESTKKEVVKKETPPKKESSKTLTKKTTKTKEKPKINRITQRLEKIEVVDTSLVASAISPPQKEVQKKVAKQEVEAPKKETKLLKQLPKLTDDLKKSFKKIIDDIKDKKDARVLNEKLRRVGNYPEADLEKKLKNLKPGKLYAIVTNREATKELADLAKEKNVKFLVTKASSLAKDPSINIVSFEEILK